MCIIKETQGSGEGQEHWLPPHRPVRPFLSALPEEHFSVKMYKVSGEKREQKKHIFSSAGDPRDIQNGHQMTDRICQRVSERTA